MWRDPRHLHAFCSWEGEYVGRLVLVAEARIEIPDLIIIREKQAYGLPTVNVVHRGEGRANCTTCKCVENVFRWPVAALHCDIDVKRTFCTHGAFKHLCLSDERHCAPCGRKLRRSPRPEDGGQRPSR